LLLRAESQRLLGRSAIHSPNGVRDYLRLHFAMLPHEVFVVIYLDAQSHVIACEEVFRGTLTQTSVYPREIVGAALQCHAACVILAHNHPSGTPEPSRADEFLTRQVAASLALIDVRVLDHVLYGGGSFVSFAERGLL
jgi:DNA repair protein RadC